MKLHLPEKHTNEEIKQQEAAKDLEELMNKIVELKQIEGLKIDLMGSWLWIGGDTKPHREELKKAGCRWAPKKGLWYWHIAKETKHYKRRTTCSMEEIEKKYGRQAI